MRQLLALRLAKALGITLLGAFAANAGAPPNWTSNGPDGGSFQVIAIAPSDPAVLYAGENNIYRSDDGAETWQLTQIPVTFVRAIAVDPTDEDTVYAGTANGVYRSSDGGNTSDLLNDGLGSTVVFSLIIDPDDRNTLLAGTVAGVFRTTDGGTTWAGVSGLVNGTVRSLVSTGAGVFYAGADDKVFKSNDGGITWNDSSNQLPGEQVNALAADPNNDSILFAGLAFTLYRSVDAGATWAESSDNLAPSNGVPAIVVDPANSQTVYAALPNIGLFQSTSAGASWTRRDAGLQNIFIRGLAIDPSDPQTLYVATNGRGVFKTEDGGQFWEPKPIGVRHLFVRSVAAAGSNPDIVYAASDAGADVSEDGGLTWTARSGAIVVPRAEVLAVDPMDPDIAYLGVQRPEGGVYKTVDRGLTWTLTDPARADSVTGAAIAIDPNSPSTLYAALNPQGIFKSIDGATSWTLANQGITNNNAFGIAIDPSDPQILYAATNSGVFKSVNGAASWSVQNNGLSTSPELAARTLAIDPSTPATIYVATRGGLFKSTDGAATWQRLENGFGLQTVFFSVAVDPNDSQHVLAGGNPTGMFRSLDGGASWEADNDGLTSMHVRQIEFVDVDPPRIYAALAQMGIAVRNSTASNPTPTEIAADTPTPTATLGNTPTPGAGCPGDCDGNGVVSINELVRAVGIALGRVPIGSCSVIDTNGDGRVSISELIAATNRLLNGC